MRTQIRTLVTAILALLLVLILALPASAGPQGASPTDRLIALLLDPKFGLPEIKAEVRAIEERVGATSPVKLSSGLFLIPPGAASVDWSAVNKCTTDQTVTVTVYKHPIGLPTTIVPPGPVTVTLAPDEIVHNANSVGPGQPFNEGFYYEVVLEAPKACVLPTVLVWSGFGAEYIPGTQIAAGDWVAIP